MKVLLKLVEAFPFFVFLFTLALNSNTPLGIYGCLSRTVGSASKSEHCNSHRSQLTT